MVFNFHVKFTTSGPQCFDKLESKHCRLYIWKQSLGFKLECKPPHNTFSLQIKSIVKHIINRKLNPNGQGNGILIMSFVSIHLCSLSLDSDICLTILQDIIIYD